LVAIPLSRRATAHKNLNQSAVLAAPQPAVWNCVSNSRPFFVVKAKYWLTV
jgi:hypothetical protein